MGILIFTEETIHETPQWKKGWHEIDDFTLKWSKLCLITFRRFMCAYVLCQMDYSSPVFPVMDGPSWTLRKCPKFTWV